MGMNGIDITDMYAAIAALTASNGEEHRPQNVQLEIRDRSRSSDKGPQVSTVNPRLQMVGGYRDHWV